MKFISFIFVSTKQTNNDNNITFSNRSMPSRLRVREKNRNENEPNFSEGLCQTNFGLQNKPKTDL